MSWDPDVQRKYSNTGHFRLLNQVRTELKNNPLARPKQNNLKAQYENSVKTTSQRISRPPRLTRTENKSSEPTIHPTITTQKKDAEPFSSFTEVKPLQSFAGKSTETDTADQTSKVVKSQSEFQWKSRTHSEESKQQDNNPETIVESKTSFRDRLNAVEMR